MEKEINESNQSIYCYEGTSILINKKNIKNYKELEKIENMLVTYKLSKIIGNETDFKRDLTINHYLAIHKYLFEDLYTFAGELRKEFTNKKNDAEGLSEEGIRIYCNPDFIYDCLKEQLNKMKKEAVKIYTRDNLIDFLTRNYFELYYIHPFREGNSRTLREFLREYVEIMNKLLFTFGEFELTYTELDKEDTEKITRSVIWNTSENTEKQEQSYNMLREVFKKCLIEKAKTR